MINREIRPMTQDERGRAMERDAINKSRSAATMKVDINKTYRTKSGHPVVIYAIYEGQEYAVHGAYQDEDGEWRARTWQLDGYFYEDYGPTEFDLDEVRPERVVWINVYEGGKVGWCRETKEEADRWHGDQRIALHRVVLNEDTVWREGGR